VQRQLARARLVIALAGRTCAASSPLCPLFQSPSHRSMPRFCQYRKCFFRNYMMQYRNRKPMRNAQTHSPCSLPARPIRLPEDLPAGRVGNSLSMYLIRIALLTRRSSICGSESIFLPAFREAPECGRGDLRLIAARGSRVVPGQSRRPVRRPPVQALRRSPCEERALVDGRGRILFQHRLSASVRDPGVRPVVHFR